MLTAEQLAFRRTGIFASDVAMLTGHSPYGGPFDVFNAKVLGHEREQTFPMELGDLMEPVTLELYRRRTGATLTFPGSTKHPEIDFLGATPDALSGDRVVQCKNCNPWARDDFGAAGTDEIPPGYLVQVQFEMLVLGKRTADVPVLFGTQSFEIFTVHYDAGLAQSLATIATAFWQDHILRKFAPPIDATPACGAYLADRFPVSGEPLKKATPDDSGLAKQINVLKSQLASTKAQADKLTNQLRERIGDSDGIQGPDWRATWRFSEKQGRRNFRLKFDNEESENG